MVTQSHDPKRPLWPALLGVAAGMSLLLGCGSDTVVPSDDGDGTGGAGGSSASPVTCDDQPETGDLCTESGERCTVYYTPQEYCDLTCEAGSWVVDFCGDLVDDQCDGVTCPTEVPTAGDFCDDFCLSSCTIGVDPQQCNGVSQVIATCNISGWELEPDCDATGQGGAGGGGGSGSGGSGGS
jgi:hypothetical protein